MLCAPLRDLPVQTVTLHAPVECAFQRGTVLEVLGAKLSHIGGTNTSLEHRLCKASAAFCKNGGVFGGPGSANSILRAWGRGPSTSAIFGCSSWHAPKSVMTRLKVYEWTFLRQVLKKDTEIERTSKSVQPVCVFIDRKALQDSGLFSWYTSGCPGLYTITPGKRIHIR